jgi:putative resolvase
VSGHDQTKDLERQLARLRKYSRTFGLSVVREIKEIGPGLNGHRKQLVSLLSDTEVTVIAVEHRDRLMRFGADYVEAAMAASGRRLIVVDDGEMKDDLVRDIIDVMTSFCARLYGRRSAGRRALAGVSAMASHEK